MKKIPLLVLFVLACASLRAANYEYLVFTTTGGDITMKADGLKMTFSDGNLVAANNEETRTIALSSLSKFCFSDGTTGVENAPAATADEEAGVYNASGQLAGHVGNGTTVETLQLPKGVYIVKGKTQSRKLVVQ